MIKVGGEECIFIFIILPPGGAGYWYPRYATDEQQT